MKLKDNILKEIKNNDAIRIELMRAHKKVETTILRWLRENAPELTFFISLGIISYYLKKEIIDLVIMEEHEKLYFKLSNQVWTDFKRRLLTFLI